VSDVVKNTLKDKLEAGEFAIGPFLGINSPDLVEIMGLSGFDFLVIDTEHGPMSPESIQHLIRAAEVRSIVPIVRVTDQGETTILRTLDVGAYGIEVPQVNSPEAAERVVSFAKYYPRGTRGVAFPRASGYGMCSLDSYIAEANKETMVIVHCENKLALECLDEIAAVDGVDVVFVGPYDLSQSLGVPGKVDSAVVRDAIDRALEMIRKSGKVAGIFVATVDDALARIEQGFQYIGYSMDSILFGSVCKAAVDAIRSKGAKA
jgi:4-hydroxy-2-oxoheptanedioate aldolase